MPAPGKEDPHQADGQLALGAGEAGRDQLHEQRRRQHAEQDRTAIAAVRIAKKVRADLRRGLVLAARAQRRMDRNERSGQRPFAEQVLQQVGDAEGGVEGVDGDAVLPELARDQPHPEQPGEAADQDPGADRRVRAREPARERLDAQGHEVW